MSRFHKFECEVCGFEEFSCDECGHYRNGWCDCKYVHKPCEHICNPDEPFKDCICGNKIPDREIIEGLKQCPDCKSFL